MEANQTARSQHTVRVQFNGYDCPRCRWIVSGCITCNPTKFCEHSLRFPEKYIKIVKKRKSYEALSVCIREVQQKIFDMGEQKRQLELDKVGLKIEIKELEEEVKLLGTSDQVKAFLSPELRSLAEEIQDAGPLAQKPRRPRWKELKAIAKEAETLPATQATAEEDIRVAK